MKNEELAKRIVREVAELPDRTSPEDWPEAMLVTGDELATIVREALRSQAGAVPTSIPASFPPDLCEKTADLVVRFSLALAEKLHAADEKYGHGHSWIEADWKEGCIRDLHHHLSKGDPRDVAAYCAFMWHHGWSTTAAPPSPAADERVLKWPAELTAALRQTLGLMCFDTGPIAHAFRAAGHVIPKKVEDEQAFVLHWLVGIALEHGEGWQPIAGAKLKELRSALAARKADGNGGEG